MDFYSATTFAFMAKKDFTDDPAALESMRLMFECTGSDTLLLTVTALQDHAYSIKMDWDAPDVMSEKDIRTCIAAAKRMGKKEKLDVAEWNAKAYDVMLGIVRAKFSNPELAKLLLATGDRHIEEGNKWHDNVWGHCTCEKCRQKPGRNQLGRILMLVRSELRDAGNRQ